MGESEQGHLLNHLRDMQAIELHGQRQLARLADRAEDDDLRDICCEHLEQTQQHEQKVKELVEAQGHEPSALEDKTLRAGAVGLRQLADIAPDTPPRVAIQLFGLEQLEIAGYELLEHIAEREGEQDVANAAREILEQEREAAEKVQERFERAAELLVEQHDSDEDRKSDDDEGERGTPLLGQLTELHALEEQSLQLLHMAADDVCEDEEFEQMLREHHEQSKEHEELIKQRLEGHDAKPSAVRDLHMGSARSGLRDLAAHPPDAYVKLAMNLCCLEHVEAAAYQVVGKVAKLSDDRETTEVAEKILKQEREAAEKVREQFEHAVELMYSSDGSYEEVRRAETRQPDHESRQPDEESSQREQEPSRAGS